MTAISAVPISVWTGYYGQAAQSIDDPIKVIQAIGANNYYVVAGLSLLIIQVTLLLFWDRREREWKRQIVYWRTRRSTDFQRKIMEVYCKFLERELGVTVSARVFEVRTEASVSGTMEDRLYQLRDLYVEREAFPQEIAFTYIVVGDDNFVTSRSIKTRAPIFEVLKENHLDNYGERERAMVEPKQRWVLAAPIIQLSVDNRATDELPPKGCVCYYGKSVPRSSEGSISSARSLARDSAELLSGSAINVEDVETSG